MPPEADTGTPPQGAAPNTPAAPPVEHWTTGLDAELVGHAQNRGLYDLDPKAAAQAAVKAHKEAERYLGVPADRIVKLPAGPEDEAGWNTLYQKLGAPADPKEYDFSTVKIGEQPLPEKTQDFLRAQAQALHLNKDGAIRLAQAYVKDRSDAVAAEAADYTAKIETEKAALKSSWGQNFDANMVVAKNTAAKLGVTPEQVSALEKAVGYKGVMEMFRAIGQKTGEADFVSNGSEFNRGIMTREQAVARREELKRDANFTKRFLEGGAAERREMTGLQRIITGVTE